MLIIQPINFGLRCLFTRMSPSYIVIKRGVKNWPETAARDVPMPKLEDRGLPLLNYTPTKWPEGVIPPVKHPKEDDDMRGPERIHNQLIYRQYGIITVSGGALQGAHFDIIRDRVNKYMDMERFFAIWRLDAPWKAVSKKGYGKKRGGGVGKVHHYETPVKAGRVLIEVAGIGEFEEVKWILSTICKKLPLYAMPVSQEILDSLLEMKRKQDERNYNPFEYRDILRRNFSDSQRFISPKELAWGGTYF